MSEEDKRNDHLIRMRSKNGTLGTRDGLRNARWSTKAQEQTPMVRVHYLELESKLKASVDVYLGGRGRRF